MTLEDAILAGDLSKTETLLVAGTAVDRRGRDGITPLMLAAGRGLSPIVEVLLRAGADVHTLEPHMGATALHKAALSGNVDVVDQLLDHGAFIDQQASALGQTPLMDAVIHKHERVVRRLLARGAKTVLRNHYQQTAIEMARAAGLNVIADLIEAADQNAASQARAQTLMAAVKAGDLARVQQCIAEGVLIDERAPVTGGVDDDYTPLGVAARDGHSAIVRVLLEAGADPRQPNGLMGGTPGHEAAYMGHGDVIQVLTETRARRAAAAFEIDTRGVYNGFTALHDAVWHGHMDAARALVEAGARLDLRSQSGLTPRELAILYDYDALAACLDEAEQASKGRNHPPTP